MRATGIVRKVDHLGRIIIPREIRNTLQFDEREALEIFTDNDRIVLQKYNPGCIICGEIDNTKRVKGKLLCKTCIEEYHSQSH